MIYLVKTNILLLFKNRVFLWLYTFFILLHSLLVIKSTSAPNIESKLDLIDGISFLLLVIVFLLSGVNLSGNQVLLYLSMPVLRKKYVISKYLIWIINMLFVSVWSVLCVLGNHLIKGSSIELNNLYYILSVNIIVLGLLGGLFYLGFFLTKHYWLIYIIVYLMQFYFVYRVRIYLTNISNINFFISIILIILIFALFIPLSILRFKKRDRLENSLNKS